MYVFSFLSPHCSYIDLDSGTARVEKYKSVEPAYVDQVFSVDFGMENWN